MFDKGGNGFIGQGELRYVLTSLGEKLSNSEVDELLKGVKVERCVHRPPSEFTTHDFVAVMEISITSPLCTRSLVNNRCLAGRSAFVSNYTHIPLVASDPHLAVRLRV